MEISLFLLMSIGLILIPGPNVLVIVSTSISHGALRGLQTVAGTSMAMGIQLLVAAVGTGWLVASLTQGLFLLKWFGVCYLFYLGLTSLFVTRKREDDNLSAIGSFHRGFWVSLTNPKTIVFFSAFLPQFVVYEVSYNIQIFYLSLLFWCLASAFDSIYALLASKLSVLIRKKNASRIYAYISGVLYLGAGTVLATTKNS